MIRYRSENRSEKRAYLIPVIVGLALIAGLLIGRYVGSGPLIITTDKESWESASSVQELLQLINLRYVDSVGISDLSRSAIKSILVNMDPHATYIESEELVSLNNQTDGHYEGIGVEFYIMDTVLLVYKVIEDSPASQAGIKPGDQIIGINDQRFSSPDYSVQKGINELRDSKLKKATLAIRTIENEVAKKIELQKVKLTLNPVSIAFTPVQGVVYIRLDQFNGLAYKNTMAAIEELIHQDSSFNLILDLRGNQGGMMQEAVNLLSQLFKEKDRLLLYTQGRNYKRTEYKTTGKNFFEINKVVILTDERSASASEVMAACIQDLDRGLIIGNTSYGKGTVQEQIDLKNGDAVRLTVARYFTPSGRTIHKDQDISNVGKSKEDILYQSRRGRKLQGHSGVIPDFKVFENDIFESDISATLDSLINDVVVTYLLANPRPPLEKVNSIANSISESLYLAFQVEASKNVSLAIYAEQMYRKRMITQLFFRWGRICYGDSPFFLIAHKHDPALNIALEKLNEADPLMLKSKPN